MIGFLRLVGLFNAGIWLGATIFFTFVAGPAFFSADMTTILPPPYNGAAAEIVIERYFLLQLTCGGIALLHLLVEWLYTGRPMERFLPGLLITIFCLTLIGGLWLQPALKHWHLVKYNPRVVVQERQRAANLFGIWHGISQGLNLIATAGIVFYFWRTANAKSATRLISVNKFRG